MPETIRKRRGRIGWRGLGWLAAALVLVPVLDGPARAGDSVTVNHSAAYVDPSIAAVFVTTPNLCDEPIGSQGTSAVACNPLGEAAVTAATGKGPDVYFEPEGSILQATNAFVPHNAGSVGDTGYAPAFVFHKYDLFGSGHDLMGPFTREEILFLEQIPITGGGITNGQTTPGENTRLRYISVLLTQPEGATTISVGGHTFDFADLLLYRHVTGFSSGKGTTVNNWCDSTIGATICSFLTAEQKGDLYAVVHFPAVQTVVCGSTQNPLTNETNCKNRDQWINQVVAGYVQSWDSLGSDAHFAQNFRTQVGYDPNAAILDSGTQTWTDFRLEQSVELSGAFTTAASDPTDTKSSPNQDNIAGRQTLQMAMATISNQSLGGIEVAQGQLVSQDVNGYLFSCLNCESDAAGYSHAFAPAPAEVAFQPYQPGWNVVPTVLHAAP